MRSAERSGSASKRRESIKSTPRPRDRKVQIVGAARALFADKGYAAVSAEEIASQVGITAGALYRHFSGKQDLLVHGLIDALDAAAEEVEGDQSVGIDNLVGALMKVAATTRELGVLWGREVRLLDEEQRNVVRTHFFHVFAVVRGRLAAARPELSAGETELLTWSMLAILTSVSYHRETLSHSVTKQLHDIAVLMCEAQLVPMETTKRGVTGLGVWPHGRRELILATAGDLFHRRGFSGTSMSDIGESLGMTGAAIYRYFPTKADILTEITTRALGGMQVGLAHALATANDTEAALENALDAYIGFASQNPHLIDILLWEVRHLPESDRRNVRRAQREYIAEWEALLRELRPTISGEEARVVVQAVLTVINDAVRTASLRAAHSLPLNLARLGRTMLTAEHEAQRS